MMKKYLSILAGSIALSTASSHAVVLLTFTETAQGVEMTSAGSLALAAGNWHSDATTSATDLGTMTSVGIFAVDDASDYEIYEGNDLLTVDFATNSGLLEASGRNGGQIAIVNDRLLMFQGATNDNVNSGNLKTEFDIDIIWLGETYESLGINHHDKDTIINLWESPLEQDFVQFTLVSAIPEPSSSALLTLGGLCFLTKRKRH